MLLFIFVFFQASNDDDFMPYENHTESVNIELNGDVFIISDIEDQLYEVISRYENNMKFLFAEYKLFENGEGEAFFGFSKSNYDTGQGIAIHLIADVKTNSIVSINYTMGYGRRIPSLGSRSLGKKDVDIHKTYTELIENNEYRTAAEGKNVCTEITLRNDEIIIISYKYPVENNIAPHLYYNKFENAN